MKTKKILAAAALVATPAIFAHAGHDPEAVTSGLIHAVAVLSLIGVAFVAYKISSAKKTLKQNIEK